MASIVSETRRTQMHWIGTEVLHLHHACMAPYTMQVSHSRAFGLLLTAFHLWYSLTGVLNSVMAHMQSCVDRMFKVVRTTTWKTFQDVQFLLNGVVLLWFIAERTLCTEGRTGRTGRDAMPSGSLHTTNILDWFLTFCIMQLTLMFVQLIALGIHWLLPDVGFLCTTIDNVWTALCNFAQQSHDMQTWSSLLFNTLPSGDPISGVYGRFRLLMPSCPWRVWTLLTLLRLMVHWLHRLHALLYKLAHSMFSVIQYGCFHWHSNLLFVDTHYHFLEMHTIHWHDSYFLNMMLPCICLMMHTDLFAYMEMLTIPWLPRLDSFPKCWTDDLPVLATELSYMVCLTIHCLIVRCSCCLLQWCSLVVHLLTEIPYMVCQTIHWISNTLALRLQMSFFFDAVQASTWISLKPVPSPVIVPKQTQGLGTWLLRFRLDLVLDVLLPFTS